VKLAAREVMFPVKKKGKKKWHKKYKKTR
jgi:hypothetical protein